MEFKHIRTISRPEEENYQDQADVKTFIRKASFAAEIEASLEHLVLSEIPVITNTIQLNSTATFAQQARAAELRAARARKELQSKSQRSSPSPPRGTVKLEMGKKQKWAPLDLSANPAENNNSSEDVSRTQTPENFTTQRPEATAGPFNDIIQGVGQVALESDQPTDNQHFSAKLFGSKSTSSLQTQDLAEYPAELGARIHQEMPQAIGADLSDLDGDNMPSLEPIPVMMPLNPSPEDVQKVRELVDRQVHQITQLQFRMGYKKVKEGLSTFDEAMHELEEKKGALLDFKQNPFSVPYEPYRQISINKQFIRELTLQHFPDSKIPTGPKKKKHARVRGTETAVEVATREAVDAINNVILPAIASGNARKQQESSKSSKRHYHRDTTPLLQTDSKGEKPQVQSKLPRSVSEQQRQILLQGLMNMVDDGDNNPRSSRRRRGAVSSIDGVYTYAPLMNDSGESLLPKDTKTQAPTAPMRFNPNATPFQSAKIATGTGGAPVTGAHIGNGDTVSGDARNAATGYGNTEYATFGTGRVYTDSGHAGSSYSHRVYAGLQPGFDGVSQDARYHRDRSNINTPEDVSYNTAGPSFRTVQNATFNPGHYDAGGFTTRVSEEGVANIGGFNPHMGYIPDASSAVIHPDIMRAQRDNIGAFFTNYLNNATQDTGRSGHRIRYADAEDAGAFNAHEGYGASQQPRVSLLDSYRSGPGQVKEVPYHTRATGVNRSDATGFQGNTTFNNDNGTGYVPGVRGGSGGIPNSGAQQPDNAEGKKYPFRTGIWNPGKARPGAPESEEKPKPTREEERAKLIKDTDEWWVHDGRIPARDMLKTQDVLKEERAKKQTAVPKDDLNTTFKNPWAPYTQVEFGNDVLAPAITNLATYKTNKELTGWTKAPGWAIDSSPNGNNSFFSETEWKGVPHRVGRDSRYVTTQHEGRTSVFEDPTGRVPRREFSHTRGGWNGSHS